MDNGSFARRTERHASKQMRAHRSIPYITYRWPHDASVRDFTWMTPLSENSGDVIGTVHGTPVAVKRRIGKGLLVFLGSPMGPALAADDREAHSWLKSLAAATSRVPLTYKNIPSPLKGNLDSV